MKKYFATVRDREGNSVAGAEVYIRDNDTNSLLTIYSDNGVTTTTNPLTTDNDGQCSAYVADGVLKVQVYIDGSLEQEKTGIQHYDDQDNEIKALRSVTSAANKGFMFTGSGTGATYDLTAAGLALLDDADAAAQRTTLGLGTAATSSSGSFLAVSNNLSDVANASTARTNLGLGTSATHDAATAAQIQAGTASKVVEADKLHDAHAPQTLTDQATISWDMSAGFNAKVTLGGNRTFATPTNPKVGLTYVLEVIQDGTGSRVPTLPSSSIWNFGAAGAPTFSTAAGKCDIITLYCRDAATPKFRAVFSKDG